MPPIEGEDNGDEIDPETDSSDSNLLEMMKVPEEERQAAINRVPFDWCETVRAVGERYQDGATIPELAAERGVATEVVRRAVKTYLLLFSESPVDEVSLKVLTNGRQYFEDSCRLEDLEAETRREAEEIVRAFVGRTLLENDLDAVDINEPVPEMASIWLDEREGLTEIDDNLPEFQGPSLSLSFYSDLIEQTRKNVRAVSALMESGVMQDVQSVADELTRAAIPDVKHGIQPSYSALTAGSVLASSAAASSMAAVSAGAAIDPTVVQAAAQLPVQEVVQSLQAIPMAELMEQLNRQSRLAEQVINRLNELHLGTAGLGSMGAVASRPGAVRDAMPSGPGEGFEPPGPVRPLADLETASVTESRSSVGNQARRPEVEEWWSGDQIPDWVDRAGKGMLIVLPPVLMEAVAFELQQLYPNHPVTIMYAKLVAIAAIELWLWNRFDEN